MEYDLSGGCLVGLFPVDDRCAFRFESYCYPLCDRLPDSYGFRCGDQSVPGYRDLFCDYLFQSDDIGDGGQRIV